MGKIENVSSYSDRFHLQLLVPLMLSVETRIDFRGAGFGLPGSLYNMIQTPAISQIGLCQLPRDYGGMTTDRSLSSHMSSEDLQLTIHVPCFRLSQLWV